MAPPVTKSTRASNNVKNATKCSVKNSVKPCSDVKNIGAVYANAGKVCLNCLLQDDNRPIIIIWSAFEHLQQIIKEKMEPTTGEASCKLIMVLGLVVQTLTGIRCGLWICDRCRLHKNGLEADLELLTKGTMLELGQVPIRILEDENTSEPPEFHSDFPHVDWLKSGYMAVSEFSNFSSSWVSLTHISTFLRAVASNSSKFLGMMDGKVEWRLRVGSLSEYWSVTRSGCGEDLKINFAGLMKKIYRVGFQKLSNRSREPDETQNMMLKLSKVWTKGFRVTDTAGDGAKFLHNTLNRLARYGWIYEAGKPALASLEHVISLDSRQERANRKRKLQGGISADNICGHIMTEVSNLNCFARSNITKLHNKQEWQEKAIRALHVKTDLIISLLREQSARNGAAPEKGQKEAIENKFNQNKGYLTAFESFIQKDATIQPPQPSGGQENADEVQDMAGPSNSDRKPPSDSASEFSDISEDEEMEVGGDDVLGNLVQAQGINQAGLDVVEPHRDEVLHTPPMINIDEHLHQQVDAESRVCEEFLNQQGAQQGAEIVAQEPDIENF